MQRPHHYSENDGKRQIKVETIESTSQNVEVLVRGSDAPSFSAT